MFSFLDIWFIKRELEDLKGSRFEKLFKGENFILFQFSKEKKLFLKYIFGKAIFLADKEKNRGFFTQKNETDKKLENLIERFIVKDIKIYPGERILDLILEGFGKKKTLRFQIFGKGNLLVISENEELNYNKIETKPEKNINIKVFDDEKYFYQVFRDSQLDEKKFLANYLGFGKFYLNEFIERFKDFTNLFEKVNKFVYQPLKPFLAEKRPFPIEMITQKKIKEYKTFSEALDDYFRPKSEFEKKIEEIKKSIEKNKEKIKEMEKEAEALEEMGNLIYNYYAFFEEILNHYKVDKEKTISKLKEFGFEIKDNCIEIELNNLKEKLKNLFGY